MKYVFHSAARVEFVQAVVHYETQKFGLGENFEREIYRCLNAIAATPLSFPRIYGEVRRCLTNTFKYAVVYRAQPDGTIVVIAVAHQSRRPRYWRSRLK